MLHGAHPSQAPTQAQPWVWLEEQIGRLDYWLRPHRRHSWGGPFNGQTFRQQLFTELAGHMCFVAAVETGAYHGTTTRFLRRATGVPIHSFESNARRYGFARANLRSLPGVQIHRCDSRAGLVHLANANALPTGIVFFYLDAHGCGALPLAEEVDLAFRHWPTAVVMIDDFQVPDDPGYAFDDYGGGQAPTLRYLADHRVLPPCVWFPACASERESGARRGCVVLAAAPDVARQIDTVMSLRRWSDADSRMLAAT